MVQVLRPMPYVARPQARHLYRSRHGIWYVRWVVPADLRARFPQLPKELKRSTKTAETRAARRFAREFLGQCILRLNSCDLGMADTPDDRLNAILGSLIRGPVANGARQGADHRLVTPMVVERDPVTRRITRVETQPHDPDPAKLINELFRAEREAEAAESHRQAPQAVAHADVSVTSQAPALEVTPTGRSRKWLGEAVDQYLENLKRKGNHSDGTLKFTIAPSLRIFRELISTKRRAPDDEDTLGPWDISLGDITPDRLDDFVSAFWKFPSRQGKRPGTADAKEVLALGGAAQSTQNASKRLNHVLGLLQWLGKRQEVEPAVVGRLQAAVDGMALDQGDTHEHQACLSVDTDFETDDSDDEGYVAFSQSDLERIFHPQVFTAHAAGDAARYWMPLLGRYTSCRLNELAQASVRDVRTLDDLPCLSVTDAEFDAQGRPVPRPERKKRLKTKSGRRILPLHPELIRLGFLDYVQQRRDAGARFLFDLKWTEKDGFGKYPGRDFRLLTQAVGVWVHKRKVFHSFRATLSQELESAGLEGMLIDRVLGHKVKSIRLKHYGRNEKGTTFPLKSVYAALCKVSGVPNVPTWTEVRSAKGRRLKAICASLGFVSAAKSG